jgi:epoxide hydrolase-like predicted phosphatase
MKPRAVIFDLGGVVLGSPIQVFRQYEADLGLQTGFLSHIVRDHGAAGAWSRLERGELDMEGFFVAFDAEAAAAGATIRTLELMNRIDAYCQPRELLIGVVRKIRASGLRTAALTNNWLSADQRSKMELLRPEFDVFVESAREGLRKPEPRIYELVCQRLGIEPAEAVFLDDIGSNLKPARQLGMVTIKVGDDPELAVRELEIVLGVRLR